MHELIRLLREFGADDALIALAEQFTGADTDDARAEISDDDIDALVAGLVALADDDEASAALLSEAVGVANDARTEIARRDELAEADEAERLAAIEALRGDPDGDDPDEGAEVEDTDVSDTDDPADTDADSGGEVDEAAPADGAEVPEPVAAAATPNRVARRALARRRPRHAAAPETPDPRPLIQFAADVPGIPAGHETRDLADVNRALVRRHQAFRRSSGRDERIPVATIHREFADERRLVDDRGRMLAPHIASGRVQAVIDEAVGRYRTQGQEALTAAGGLCAPPQPIYTVPVLGEQSRPIRDTALMSFQGSRGAVVSIAPPTLGALADAVSVWTVAMDEEAADSDSVVKPCLRIECGSDRETEIEAIVRCLTVGNMVARTFSEYTDAWSELAMVAYDRLAETQLFNAIAADATTVNLETTTLSATRDLLDTLSRLAWGIRSRNRLGRNFPVRVILPEILHGVIRSDIARSLPGGSYVENLAVADATIARFFAEQALNVTWSPDLAVVGAQAASTAIEPWPDTVPYAIYPEGTFLHLDAGELDLGVVRDSALNSVNDFQLFAEGFEAVHYLGTEAYNGTVEVCPSGSTSGTVDLSGICGS